MDGGEAAMKIDPSTLLSAGSLLVAWAAFYRTQLRGPAILIRPPTATPPYYSIAFDGLIPRMELRLPLLIMNLGPRSGVLEAFHSEPFIYRYAQYAPALYRILDDENPRGRLMENTAGVSF